MPSREEEFAAGKKERRGEGLCPFCGSPKVYYNKHFKSWRCGRCEKSFPSPSYGAKGKPSRTKQNKRENSFSVPSFETGSEFNDEARLFVKINEKQELEESIEPKHDVDSVNEAGENLESEEEREEEGKEQRYEAFSNGKAWFGREYYDTKSRQWKKPRRKGSSILKTIFKSFIAIIVIIIIVYILLSYLK